MDKTTEALKLALGQLQAGFPGNAMQILREALAQTELCKYGQEPKSCTSNPMDCQCAIDASLAQTQEPVQARTVHITWNADGIRTVNGVSDYTSPPQRTWIGLTDEERKDIELGIEVFGMSVEAVLKEAEAKLKEKNT